MRRVKQTIMCFPQLLQILFLVKITHAVTIPYREEQRNLQGNADLPSLLAFFANNPSPAPSILSSAPSDNPSEWPTNSRIPSSAPTISAKPSESPSPSSFPTASSVPSGSSLPSSDPTTFPSLSSVPSWDPSQKPSSMPTKSSMPSMFPTKSQSPTFTGTPTVSLRPSSDPSSGPTASVEPSISDRPSYQPSFPPSISTSPSEHPSYTAMPSKLPSFYPSISPTEIPSFIPSNVPSISPSSIPSDVPSSWPSLLPSNRPSPSPTEYPSLYPSDQPSVTPSDMPTKNPSLSPSMSIVPSSPPSFLPSVSLNPSADPSSFPSLSLPPSDGPSSSPSSTPTLSSFPSHEPSLMPSVSMLPTLSSKPSTNPSQSPSTAPSSLPTNSKAPSTFPSTQPSSLPSDTPSDLPSRMPSHSPSDSPSEAPSTRPTENPSQSPSDSPSRLPSFHPSALPSASPSSLPSESPTLTCHDNLSYRSPINDLTCEDHAGTDCVQWKVLGLNTDELGELLNNCPETCAIQCGAFSKFSISVSYRLSSINELLDNSEKEGLEKVSRDFLTSFVRENNPDMIFELDTVELTSQSFLNSQRRMRNLSEDKTILVSFLFEGFIIDLGEEVEPIATKYVTDQLVSGIDSQRFTSMVQGSGVEKFMDTKVSSISEAYPARWVGVVDNKADRDPSTATVVVSTLVSISICSFAIGAFIYHSRSGKWIPQLKLPALRDSRIDHQISNSPSNNWHSSQPGSLLSFDESPAVTISNSTPGLLRLITSLSLSRSKSSTSLDDSSSQSNGTSQPPGQLVSPMSDETQESEIGEHPLANIIPPMIVMDNIEDDIKHERSDHDRKRHSGRQLVPSKRVEAPPALLAAINESRQSSGPNAVAGMLYNTETFVEDLNANAWYNVDESTRVMSPLGIIIDSDSEDEASVVSTPVHPTMPRTPLILRRSVSSSALECLDRPRERGRLFSDERTINFLSSSGSTSNANGDINDECWSFASVVDEDESSIDLAYGPEPVAYGPEPVTYGRGQALENQNYPSHIGEMQLLPPIHPSTPDNRSETESSRWSVKTSSSPNEGGRLIQSLRALSPIAKVIKDSTHRTLKRSKLPMRTDFGLSKRKSPCDISVHSEEGHGSAQNSSSSVDHAGSDYGFRYEFEAPRKGQLGLIIESKNETGPIVHAVKDYSPLFGLVKPGDKIVEVDGRKTSQSTLTEITRLLAVRPGRRGTNLRIVVQRQNDIISPAQATRILKHSRDSSYGSSSLGSSRVLEDVDADATELPLVEPPPDDLLKHSRNSYSDHGAEDGDI